MEDQNTQQPPPATLAPEPPQPAEPTIQPTLDVSPAPAPIEQPTATPPSPTLLERASSRGLDTSGFQDEDALLDALVEGHQSFAASQPYIEAGKQYFATPPAPPEPAPPAEPIDAGPQPFDWDLPEINERYKQLCDFRDGMFYAPADLPALIPKAAELNEAHAVWQERATQVVEKFPSMVNRVIDDRFEQGLPSVIEEAVRKQVDAIVGETLTQRQAATESDRYLADHRADLFITDTQGNVQRNPQTGQELLTPQGEAFAGYVQKYRQAGVSSDAGIFALVKDRYEADLAAGRFGKPGDSSETPGQPSSPPSATPPSGPEPAVAPGARKQGFIDRAIETQRTVNRDGSLEAGAPDSPPEEDPDVYFGRALQRGMAAKGMIEPAT